MRVQVCSLAMTKPTPVLTTGKIQQNEKMLALNQAKRKGVESTWAF